MDRRLSIQEKVDSPQLAVVCRDRAACC